MKALYRYFLHSPKTLTLVLLTVASLVFNLWASRILTESYVASKFPVPYFVAQLSFNPEQLKTWYAFLIEHGTLNKYLQTQHIDSLFILSTLLLHSFALVLISRLFVAESKGRKVMVICALISAIAPISDQLENLVSYIMLADPQGFFNGLAYIYSSFAATKFAFFVFAYLAAPLGILAAAISFLLSRIALNRRADGYAK
ncbi:hypothetical protein GCM10011613_23040 [Cellvibrio zantedeschiae]|uniref:Uncharacterized protein n=1 Tax=Cellvibrio zantedeschiae TaxID=1237077 RepID=A0ABQ3B4H8_9GAMM|nr:hypothetical protein [Cellvibrio zantedeschiae]GGY77846.1 hypothetical protein GCM10011613_23040 [Cellvibrio zantedeschiae]